MKRILKEPLVHFLLLGAAIFLVYSVASKHSTGEPGKIVITQGQLESLLDGFTQTRQRPPTQDEWEGLIRDRVRQEVLYREALALDLDKDDLIIRRRLQQKMEFISDGAAAQAQPTDAELNAYLQSHPDSFRVDQQFTFRQVFLNPDKRGKNLASDSAQLLAELQRDGGTTDISKMGDSIMLDNDYHALPASEAGRIFGGKFATSLVRLPLSKWQGPLESAYGMHLVFVSEHVGGRAPALSEVHDAVRREWDEAHRAEANDRFYAELLKHYIVTIEKPEPAENEKKVAKK